MSITSSVIKFFDWAMDRAWNKYNFPEIEQVNDIVYDPAEDKTCLLDIYRKKSAEKQPVFFNIHGGGFVGGNRSGRRGFSKYIASLGFAVVNISYGLSPKFKYPDNLRHCAASLSWVANNAEEYGFDLDKVVLSGDSAGAYLASALTALCISARFRERLDVADINIRPLGGVYYCGIYDMPYSLEHKSSYKMISSIAREAFGIKKLTEAVFEDYPYTDVVSPVDHVTEDFPIVFIAHTDSDIICVKQGERMVAKLKEHGVKFWEFRASKKANCIHCWHLTQSKPKAKACLNATKEFLQALLSGNVESNYIEI